jgi:hypothetical protein
MSRLHAGLWGTGVEGLCRFLKARNEGPHGPLTMWWLGRKRWMIVVLRETHRNSRPTD